MSTGETFNFEQVYRGPDACKFKFSLVNTGEAIYYLSEDKIMMVTLAYADPIEVQWMRATSPVIFAGIDEFETSYGPLNNNQCDLVTGAYNSILKELWFSWPTGNNSCPNISLVFNLTRGQEAADLIDHGFTAFTVYESDRLPTVGDWLIELGVCERNELPPIEPEIEPIASPASVWNSSENPDLPADADSLCAALANKYPEDFCAPCAGSKRFVMASAVDKTLKEYADTTYYREMLENGFYALRGYSSILQSGSENLKIDAEKNCRLLKTEFKADPQTSPNTLYADVAFGAEASCMTWKNIRPVYPDGTVRPGVELRCLSDFTLAQHAANQTRPGLDALFPTAVRGKFLAYRLRITGTGGGSCFSSVQMSVARAQQ